MKEKKSWKLRAEAGKKMPAWMFNVAVFFWEKYKIIKMPEKKCSFGDLNEDKTFYVIRLYPPAAGLFANYVYVLGYMKYAYDKGWIPVVDMENYLTLYTDVKMCDELGISRNVWEWYFEQPLDVTCGKRYSLDEVYKSKNVVLACGCDNDKYDASWDKDVVAWQSEMAKRVPLKEEIQEYADKCIDNVISSCEKPFDIEDCLGLPLRASDLQGRVIGHCVQLTASQSLSYINEYTSKWNLGSIFVKSEVEDAIVKVAQKYEATYYLDCQRVLASENSDCNVAYSMAESQYSSLRDYIANMYIISKCNSAIGTMNNGLYVAYLWNAGKYKHFEVIDLGRYK